MKKKRTLAALTVAGGLVLPVTTQANGIITYDPTAVAQMLEDATATAQQALDQLEATKSAAEEARSRFEGNWELADVLNDPTLLSYLPKDDWQDIYAGRDLTDKRNEYSLNTQNSERQQEYDELLSNIAVLEDAYNASVQRQGNIEQLASYMNTAQTPQEKEDYANRLQYEQIQLAAEKTRIDSLTQLMTLKQDAQARAKALEFEKQLRGEEE